MRGAARKGGPYRNHSVDPQRYLTSVLAKIGPPVEDLGQFLPNVWKPDDAAEPVADK